MYDHVLVPGLVDTNQLDIALFFSLASVELAIPKPCDRFDVVLEIIICCGSKSSQRGMDMDGPSSMALGQPKAPPNFKALFWGSNLEYFGMLRSETCLLHVLFCRLRRWNFEVLLGRFSRIESGPHHGAPHRRFKLLMVHGRAFATYNGNQWDNMIQHAA